MLAKLESTVRIDDAGIAAFLGLARSANVYFDLVNDRLIVRAVNAHAALVAALEPFARFCEVAARSERGHGGRDTDVFYKLDDVAITLGDLRRAAAALAAARGEGP